MSSKSSKYVKEMAALEHYRWETKKEEEKKEKTKMQIISAIKTILDNTKVKEVPCRNGLCLDIKKEYWIQIKDEEFEISE